MQNKIPTIIFTVCIVLLISILITTTDKIKLNYKNLANTFRENISIDNKDKKAIENNAENNYEPRTENNPVNTNENKYISIFVNKEISLSGKTKEEIYNIRKKYVQKSIFKSSDYEPSDAVFGQIEDYKPWISISRKKFGNTYKTEGPSYQAKPIINPSLLVGIEWPYGLDDIKGKEYYSVFSTLPYIIEYNPSKKEIVALYSPLPVSGENPYLLNGINARDFGYNYAYIDSSQSKNLPSFPNNPNIANSVAEFQDHFHTGNSCGVAGGCNNWSPYQHNLAFSVSAKDFYQRKELYIKLWKKKPDLPEAPADITEKIVILPYIPPKK